MPNTLNIPPRNIIPYQLKAMSLELTVPVYAGRRRNTRVLEILEPLLFTTTNSKAKTYSQEHHKRETLPHKTLLRSNAAKFKHTPCVSLTFNADVPAFTQVKPICKHQYLSRSHVLYENIVVWITIEFGLLSRPIFSPDRSTSISPRLVAGAYTAWGRTAWLAPNI